MRGTVHSVTRPPLRRLLIATTAIALQWLQPVAAQLGAGEMKWNPGHYMLMPKGESQAARLKYFDQIADEPVIKGAQVNYFWAQLEPKKGAYDFSVIEKDLARLRAHGKHLVIVVTDRSFGPGSKQIVPEYLLTEPEYGGGVVKTRSGESARVWDAAVMDREIALYQALGRRFDEHPYVEGITSEETAMGFGSARPKDFSTGALAAQLRRWIVAVRAAWPHTNVFLYSNFLSGHLEDLIAECERNRCGAGGPDVLPPPHNGTDGERILRGASSGGDYRGRMPIAFSVQSPELGGTKGTFTPRQLFEHAYQTLHVNYIFWMRNTWEGGAEQKWSTGILPYLRSINGRIHTECPSGWQDNCRSLESGPSD
jgi:hypothetical protein